MEKGIREMISRLTVLYGWLIAVAIVLGGALAPSVHASPTAFGAFRNDSTHNSGSVAAAIANVPTNVGVVYDASCQTNDIQVVNFGTTVYTGPVDVSLSLARIRAGYCMTLEANDGGWFNPTASELPQIPHNKPTNYYMEFVVWYSINMTNATYDTAVDPYPNVAWPGPMRLIIGAGGEVYFTGDHYSNADYVNPLPCAPTGPDLAISKSHTGSFTQGDTGDTYTIMVTNVGNSASTGTVTVTDSLPAGLTATAISGTGWSTTLSTLTCTRSDALSAGAGYPSITVTVNVSASAPASVTNNASTSGGGDTNLANNAASDPTTINASNPAQLGVSPTSGLSSSGTAGGPFSPSSQIYTLTNSGNASLNWTANNTAIWLTLSSTSGSLASGAAVTVTATINATANSLSANTYSDTIGFTNTTNGAGNTTRPVTLTVNTPPAGQLSVTPTSGFASSGNSGGPFSPASQTYTLSNVGNAALAWTSSKSQSWVTLSATSGSLAVGASTNITVSINATANGLSANSYSDTVTFTNTTNGTGSTTRSVSLTVNAVAPSLAANGATLVAEYCTPTNGVIDPNETVTVSFSVKNNGNGNTANLVGTLQATGGVSSPSGAQTYGVVTAGGGAASQAFTFTAAGSCGGRLTATLQLQDGTNHLGLVSYTFPLGASVTPLAQNFDGVIAPALPAGWITSASGGESNWVTATTVADTAPNAAFSPDPTSAGVNELDTPGVAVNSATAQLSFRQKYDLTASTTNASLGYDGGVLEIKIGAGAYQDILVAGGSFVSGGYNRTLSGSYTNPLAGRQAWSGSSGTFTTTVVNLPAAAAGQNVQLRWRCSTGSLPPSPRDIVPQISNGTLAFYGFDAGTGVADTVGSNLTAAAFTVTNTGGSLTSFGGNPSTGKAIAASGFTLTAGPPTTSFSYFAFSLTVSNGNQLALSNLSFDDRASSTGPTKFEVQISTNASFSAVLYNSGEQSAHTAFTTTPMNSLALSSSNLTGTVYFRIYAYAAGASGGSWRLDNVNVQGNVSATGDITPGGTGWYIDSISLQDTACCTNPVIAPPVAGFSASPTSGTEPLTVTFSDTSTGTSPLSLIWNLGDSTVTNTADGASFAHTYPAGTYTVSLTASNAAGTSILVSNNLITALTAFQAWQNQYFGSTTNPLAAAGADPLGKGISNANQFLMGLNPTNPASTLRIISVVGTGTDVVVTWRTSGGDVSGLFGSGKTNVLEVTSGLPDGSYSNNFISTGVTNVITTLGDVITNAVDAGGATNVPSRYYRIQFISP